MTLPATVRIGGETYQVQPVADLHDHEGGLNGKVRVNDRLIEIEEEMHPAQQRVTLWHEVVHALLVHAGQHAQVEEVVGVLGYGIVQVLRDNPWLREEPPDAQA